MPIVSDKEKALISVTVIAVLIANLRYKLKKHFPFCRIPPTKVTPSKTNKKQNAKYQRNQANFGTEMKSCG